MPHLTRDDQPQPQLLPKGVLAQLVVAVEALALDLMQGTHLPQRVERGCEGQQLQEDPWAPGEVDQCVWQPQDSSTNLWRHNL